MIPIINLRGTNGSGKSFLVRGWMKQQKAIPFPRRTNLFGGDTLSAQPEYYRLEDSGVVIGSYTADCGGCDTVDSTKEVQERIRKMAVFKPCYIIFEGVIISTVFETWLEFSRSVGGMIWMYLDTPLKVCLRRVYARNRNKQIKEELVRNKIRSIESTRRKAVEAGERVIVLNWKRAEQQFQKFLRSL